jgi:endonuclease III
LRRIVSARTARRGPAAPRARKRARASARSCPAKIGDQLDALEAFYGRQKASWPTEPFRFLVWWQCGYPPSEVACEKGWRALSAMAKIEPAALLALNARKFGRALAMGGLVPELRVGRIRDVAGMVAKIPGADLAKRLKALSLPEARKLLKRYPGIAGPGADRIILFGGLSPLAAVPSNAPQVLLRMQAGEVPASYSACYRDAQAIVAGGTPETLAARKRTYLLVKHHGETLCKRSRPACASCPIERSCAFASRAAVM